MQIEWAPEIVLGTIFSYPVGVIAKNMGMSFIQAEFWEIIIGICSSRKAGNQDILKVSPQKRMDTAPSNECSTLCLVWSPCEGEPRTMGD